MVHFKSGRNSRLLPDWYQPAGLVTVTQDKRLYVKFDQKRLKRLKESGEQQD